MRYRVRAVAVGRFLVQEGQKDEVRIRRLERLIMKMVEAAGTFLWRHGGRLEYVASQVAGDLLAPFMEPQHVKTFLGKGCNVDGW